mmetsp:Transcript_27327/g.58025  ORF Transcript_27327/g.58025 Transcript_27327/m.58025 type:complete len:221 (-) Transcript_27327:287-949(-)
MNEKPRKLLDAQRLGRKSNLLISFTERGSVMLTNSSWKCFKSASWSTLKSSGGSISFNSNLPQFSPEKKACCFSAPTPPNSNIVPLAAPRRFPASLFNRPFSNLHAAADAPSGMRMRSFMIFLNNSLEPFFDENGGSPESISYAMHPKLQKSAPFPYHFLATISGAMYSIVPHRVLARPSSSSPLPVKSLASPKSVKQQCPSLPSNMFSGFKSRCNTLML